MPEGLDVFLIFPSHTLIWVVVNFTGGCVDVNPQGAKLRYNEVRRISEAIRIHQIGRLNLVFSVTVYCV